MEGHAAPSIRAPVRIWSPTGIPSRGFPNASTDASIDSLNSLSSLPTRPWSSPVRSGWTPNRVTVSVATGIGGLESLEELVHVADEDEPRASPFLIPMMMANAAAAGISIKYGFGGQVSTPSVACAAGTQAVLDGLRQIQWGYADAAVVGGTEAAARASAARGVQGGKGAVTERDLPPVRRRP